MRILYVCMKYDYGRPDQGHGFEHCNFFDSLRYLSDEIIYFDYATLLQQEGRRAMNRRLAEVAAREQPDVMFSVLFNDVLDFKTIQQISAAGRTQTVNWFSDDHWQFETISARWAPAFNWLVTTAQDAEPKYHQAGFYNVIKSQWACNHHFYRKLDLPLKYDVTFIGQPHGLRRQIVETLRRAGVDVQCWGTGWENGRLSPAEMIEVFNQSRINLNFANAFQSGSVKTSRVKRIISTLRKSASAIPGARTVYKGLSAKLPRRQLPPLPLATSLVQSKDQIKGRTFEVPGCGGFLLTGTADNLNDYYTSGQDLTTFETLEELVTKIRYYLANESVRAAVAEQGYRRTLAEHTYTNRFEEIFRRMGFEVPSLHSRTAPAKVTEITL